MRPAPFGRVCATRTVGERTEKAGPRSPRPTMYSQVTRSRGDHRGRRPRLRPLRDQIPAFARRPPQPLAVTRGTRSPDRVRQTPATQHRSRRWSRADIPAAEWEGALTTGIPRIFTTDNTPPRSAAPVRSDVADLRFEPNFPAKIVQRLLGGSAPIIDGIRRKVRLSASTGGETTNSPAPPRSQPWPAGSRLEM